MDEVQSAHLYPVPIPVHPIAATATTAAAIPATSDWPPPALDDDEYSLDAVDSIFATPFLPPPPRALFLDESATPDGLTTCDLCTWAQQRRHDDGYEYDSTAKEVPAELGWVLTLVIVSLTSALIGAIVMIVVLHCRRLKSSEVNENERGFSLHQSTIPQRPPINTPDDKDISTIAPPTFPQMPNLTHSNHGVWSWLSRKSTGSPNQLNAPPILPAENHYTHMEDGYNSVGEALYAELDRESCSAAGDCDHDHIERDSNSSPAYQNSAYTDPDAPSSSAPSSAYYSDLSTTTLPERCDRAYELVGMASLPGWEHVEQRRHAHRLAAISENASVPSDYV